MEAKTLGTEIGEICGKALDFVYEQLKDQPPVDDQLKALFSEERKSVFNVLVPLLKQQQQLDEENMQLCNIEAATAIVTVFENMEEKSQELNQALDYLAEEEDMSFLMDVQSLFLVMSFLDTEELGSYAPELIEYVGL